MQADYSVELGADDPTLSVPWISPEGLSAIWIFASSRTCCSTSKRRFATRNWENFSTTSTASDPDLQSAKCDAWFTTELNEEEQIYGVGAKFGSYVDLFFAAPEERSQFADHEEFARQLTVLLRRAPELPSAVELIIRRASFEGLSDSAGGFYLTLYVFGYGDEEEEARRHWAVSLKLVENALFQLSAHVRGRPEASGKLPYADIFSAYSASRHAC